MCLKKFLITSGSIITLLLLSVVVNGQNLDSFFDEGAAHAKGNLSLSYSLGIGSYGMDFKYPTEIPGSNYQSFAGFGVLKLDYGIADKWSIGLMLQPQADSSLNGNTTDDWSSRFFSVSGQYHFIRKNNLDVYLEFAPGYSKVKYRGVTASSMGNGTDLLEGELDGLGWKLDLGARYFIGRNKRWFFSLNMGFSGFVHSWSLFTTNEVETANLEGGFNYAGLEGALGFGFKILR